MNLNGAQDEQVEELGPATLQARRTALFRCCLDGIYRTLFALLYALLHVYIIRRPDRLKPSMAIHISATTTAKLRDKHGVSETEVRQCLENRTGGLLMDNREDHRTDPPTLWFIALTNAARLLKVCFIRRDEDLHIRTAYAPNETELRIYRKHGNPSDF